MNITMKLISYNFTSAPNRQIDYICIHDTGNRQAGANAIMHFNHFNSGNKNASADFFVDDHSILQFTDYENSYAWHCGDGGGQYGITNRNAIGIEICINSDGNYTQAVANAVELASFLLVKLNLPMERLVRHYDASRKNCPQTMNNNGDWSAWINFKERVANTVANMKQSTMKSINEYKKITASVLNVRQAPSSSSAVLGQLKFGDIVNVIGVNNDGTWFKLINGGFISVKYTEYAPAPAPAPIVQSITKTWQEEAIDFLKVKGFITQPHDQNELVTMKTFGFMMNNYTTKIGSIFPMTYLNQFGYIKSIHDENEVITMQVFGFMMMNKLGVQGVKPLDFLTTKGFISSQHAENEKVTFSVFGAMMKNFISKGGKF